MTSHNTTQLYCQLAAAMILVLFTYHQTLVGKLEL